MKAPAIPSNEAERLAALHSFQILDTEADASLDALTRLAAAILEVPIALVSLIDTDRQWFKSRYGLDIPQTPRDVSFCGHAVVAEAPLVVNDALVDGRFVDNPLVTGQPKVRFYAGMPLTTEDGFVLGTLCAIDHVAKEPTRKQLELLELLAGQVVDQLEAHRKRRQLAQERAVAVENAKRLEMLFDSIEDGVVVQAADGSVIEANLAAERILGLTKAQISGQAPYDPNWKRLKSDGSPFPIEDGPSRVALQTGKAVTNVLMGVEKPDGRRSWFSVNALPLRKEGETVPYAVLITIHDVTMMRAAQAASERLSRQERLVTTGTLAAGVGHEINNPLSFVIANLEYSIEELKTILGNSVSGRIRELVQVMTEAKDGAERIQKIVRGLRALAREESDPVPTDVGPVVDLALAMAAHEVRPKAQFDRVLGITPQVLADEARLSQVLVNLLINAAQAFPTGDLEKNRITVTSAFEVDGRVSITVADNGPGIALDRQAHIFDPFFTTRMVGQGTGLGLAISHSIIAALHGELSVDSTPGKGASFKIVLPAAVEEPAAGGAPEPLLSHLRSRVLVIDDEPNVLDSIERLLKREHDVVTSSDPREALRRLTSGAQFDVVFCDLMMPYLSGEALYTRVKVHDPKLAERFVFITAGAIDAGTRRFLAEVPCERVEKPFSMQNLRGIARRFARRD